MNFFFGCFGVKEKVEFQNDHHLAALVIPATTSKVAKIPRNQLSDLFLSQELEDICCGKKNTKCEPVDIKCCRNETTNNVADLKEQTDRAWTLCAKPGGLEKEPDYCEESPTSCVSDPSSASKNSVSTNAKCDKENFPSPVQKVKTEPASSQKDMQLNESKSSLLKPKTRNKTENKVNVSTAYGRSVRSSREGHMPVLRSVTAQWNGIPNSTTKYREDQIVSWDGTPFEERLEKALSKANSISQSKKHISGAYDTFEDDIDTATSELQALHHQKSVVSF